MIEGAHPEEIFKAYKKSMPPSHKWMVGKTNASIRFVQDCDKTIALLKAQADEVKAGREVLMDWLDVEEYLIQVAEGI